MKPKCSTHMRLSESIQDPPTHWSFWYCGKDYIISCDKDTVKTEWSVQDKWTLYTNSLREGCVGQTVRREQMVVLGETNTRDELLNTATIGGRLLRDILEHYEEEFDTEKNPRHRYKYSYEMFKRDLFEYNNQLRITISNPECVKARGYKYTEDYIYDDPYELVIEPRGEDENGVILYSVEFARRDADVLIFELCNIRKPDLEKFLETLYIQDKAFVEYCNTHDADTRVEIWPM